MTDDWQAKDLALHLSKGVAAATGEAPLDTRGASPSRGGPGPGDTAKTGPGGEA